MAETLRSGPLLVGLAVSLAAHAALLAVHWQAAPREVQRKAPAVARLTVRMQAAAVAQAAPAVAGPVAPVRAPAGSKTLRRAVAVHRKAAPPAAVVMPVETPAALPAIPAAEPPVAAAPAAAASAAAQAAIDGSVFGLPRIAFAVASPARWMPPAVRTAAAAPIAAPAPPPAAMQAAQGARDVGRQQLLQRLHHQMAQWPLPGDGGNGDCTVALDEALHCDSPALGQALLAQAGPLGGLLQAHHGLEPRTQALAIAFREGRYRVAFHLAGAPR